jgi:hypothetical protein
MIGFVFVSAAIVCLACTAGFGAESTIGRLPPPRLGQDTWIMIEVWPDVQGITLSAYFLDISYEKNRNLCEATKRVFDRDQDHRSKALKKTFSSYRFCMSLNSAIQQGYVDNR